SDPPTVRSFDRGRPAAETQGVFMTSRRQRKPLSWTAALAAYETHLRARRASPRTREDSLREVRLLAAHVEPLRPEQVRLADLRQYQVGLLTGAATRSGRPAAAGTVARV